MRKDKMKKNLKIELKLINYFQTLLQTHLTYFFTSKERLNNLKLHKFFTNFNYISFSFIFFIGKSIMRKSFSSTFFAFLNNFRKSEKKFEEIGNKKIIMFRTTFILLIFSFYLFIYSIFLSICKYSKRNLRIVLS